MVQSIHKLTLRRWVSISSYAILAHSNHRTQCSDPEKRSKGRQNGVNGDMDCPSRGALGYHDAIC